MKAEPVNVIPLAQAQTWAKRWQEASSIDIKAFLIPEIDVTQVLNEPNVENLRAYLGIDDNNNPKLMIVGVDKNGVDLINYDLGLYVYDMTSPCPKNCDYTSPLMG